MKYETHILKNGLRIILAPMAESRTATVIIMTGTGSRYEDAHENGLAHFLEHMFFKGTKKRPTARAISEELDTIGSIYNAYTSKDRTAYYAKVSANFTETAVDVLSDIFLNSSLPSREITKERGAIVQEIDMYEDMPMHTVDNVFDALIFGHEHPLGRTILGPKENIREFSRKEFTRYLKRNYAPINTVVCIAGSFNGKKTLAKIKKEFGSLPHGNPPDFIRFSSVQSAAQAAIKEKKTDQTQLMLGVPSYPYMHADEYVLAVLSTILGGGMSSRLFMEVREKRGLAYSVHSSVEKYPDTGYFVVSAGVEHGKLEEAVRTILSEFKKLKKNIVTLTELKKAKSYMKGTLALSMETSDRIAQVAATSMLELGRIRPLEEVIKGIDVVTENDIQRVASELFVSHKLNLAVIGPHVSKEKLELLLKV